MTHPSRRVSFWLSLTVLTGLYACQNNDIDPNAGTGGTPSKGSADFTKYVAIGNSLTAGYSNSGLYRSGQINSYPNILAGQFATVGGGSFTQPLFTEAQASGTGYLKLIKVPSPTDPTSLASSLTTVAPTAVRGLNTAGSPLYTKFTDANQNLGVPGIKMSDLLVPGYGSTGGNPYFERLTNDASQTYFQYVSNNLTGATFFTSWLGNNDALGYATSGGGSPLTSVELFNTNYTALINKLTEGSRKGVIIGIPNIIGTPFFTTVTAQVSALLKAQGVAGLAIATKSGVRLSTSSDYFLLSAASQFSTFLAQGIGLSPSKPVPDQYVLDASEVTALNAAVSAYNTVLKTQADAKGLAYVDVNSLFQQVGTGYTQNGITYSAAFIQGGVFSLDGLHLTPAGYALIANEIIKGINSKYGSTIPQVNPANYQRVLLQQ